MTVETTIPATEPVAAEAAAAAPAQETSVVDEVMAALGTNDDDSTQTPPAEPKPTEPQAAAATDPVKPAGDPKPDAAAKPAADKEAMPEGLSEKAQARFTELARERNEARERAQQWQQTIESTGASPEQFGELLEYARRMNSGNPEDLKAAFQMAKNAVAQLAPLVGEDIQGLDVLAGHPDLVAQVEQGDLSRSGALEILRARQTAQAFQQTQAQTAQARQEEFATQQATAQLDQLGNQLRAQDPDFDRKLELLQPTIRVLAERVPPHQWAQEFLAAFQQVRLPPSVTGMQPSPQPLRSKGAGATGVRAEPKSDSDAVLQALGIG